ncbi:conserved protein of unknown function [Pseudodesulfovibrio profundus]|uniref:Uncharacterized protein n=1 Tax=Pseudodesulfovibrio profundus TaxID=57320 RepID=A0A2C8FC97_9BACT|nr:hypothetical protein [Pseudodesulfovibrio profundus]SOB60067.1 conserved protein of unknown function [Pseudodesulfovibrio profundus]
MKKIQLIALLILLCLPVCYYLVVATDMYASTAKFSVRSSDLGSSSSLLSLVTGVGSGGKENAYLLVEFIESEAMLKQVDGNLNIREHYSDMSRDIVSRLMTDAPMEDFLEYWLSIVRVSYDSQASIVTVEARAYTPEMAQRVAEAVLDVSEAFLNRMNDRLQRDTLLQAQKELENAEIRYAKARQALNAFRVVTSELDPKATAAARVGIVAGLEAKISALQVEYDTKKQIMTENSLPVRILEKNILEFQDQLHEEKLKMTGQAGPEILNFLEEYETLSLENEFAQNYYISALSSLETSRVQSESQTVYLEAFQRPAVPDWPVYPERFKNALLSIIVVVGMYSLLLFIFAAVKEHIGV